MSAARRGRPEACALVASADSLAVANRGLLRRSRRTSLLQDRSLERLQERARHLTVPDA
jgi:hypothetical protein